MKPKEKAWELVDKCIRYHRNGIYNVVHKDIAKQYAIIVVEEILDSFKLNTGIDIVGSSVINFAIRESNYWQEVKQEIKLL